MTYILRPRVAVTPKVEDNADIPEYRRQTLGGGSMPPKDYHMTEILSWILRVTTPFLLGVITWFIREAYLRMEADVVINQTMVEKYHEDTFRMLGIQNERIIHVEDFIPVINQRLGDLQSDVKEQLRRKEK